MILNLAKIIYARSRFALANKMFRGNYSDTTSSNFEIVKILKNLNEKGFYVVHNFLDKDICKKIIKSFEEGIVNHHEVLRIDKYKCDFRMFGSENLSAEIKDYHFNSLISDISQKYLKTQTINLSTMTNRVEFVKENLGSGSADWHRDSYNKQFKSILYLSDVKKGGGGFQLINESHKMIQMVKDCNDMSVNIVNLSVDNDLVNNKLLKKNPKRLTTIEANAGSIIFVDTSLLHRGSPIEKGSPKRYAMTNYIYPKYQKNWYPKHFSKSLKSTQ